MGNYHLASMNLLAATDDNRQLYGCLFQQDHAREPFFGIQDVAHESPCRGACVPWILNPGSYEDDYAEGVQLPADYKGAQTAWTS